MPDLRRDRFSVSGTAPASSTACQASGASTGFPVVLRAFQILVLTLAPPAHSRAVNDVPPNCAFDAACLPGVFGRIVIYRRVFDPDFARAPHDNGDNMATTRWQEDLLADMNTLSCTREAFRRVERAAQALGFDLCAYGVRMPLPLSRPRTTILSNFPSAWQARYQEANYLEIDPTVAHGRRTTVPLVWSDSVFANTPEFWAEAQAAGLRAGWCQSCFGADGLGSMLTLARSAGPVSASELESQELRMRTLVSVTHMVFSRLLGAGSSATPPGKLSRRETEILRWAADGKTSVDIADILHLSVDTVNFHTKNAVRKLHAPNKTGAVVRAAMLGLLHP